MDESTKETLNNTIRSAKQLAWISGVFTALVALLLLLNYLQLRGKDPLESQVLTTLVERLVSEPNNEVLTGEVRQLDLLARKAYFNSIWQVRTGALLMLLGAVVFIFSMRWLSKLEFNIDRPDVAKPIDRKTRSKTERWMWAAGCVLLLFGGMASILSGKRLGPVYSHSHTTHTAEGPAVMEQIEIHGVDSLTLTDTTAVEEEPVEEAEPVIPFDATTVKQQYNGFRGAYGQGISTHTGIPTSFNGTSGKNILWKTKVPISGKNSPVVWGNRIYLTGATPTKRMVYGIDRLSGSILWEGKVDNIPGSPATAPQTTDDTGLAAPSVTVDGKRVFAIFGNGDIIAFTLNGERVWARNLGMPDNHYGHSSSLITWGGKVFVQYDMQGSCKVMALNAETGKTVWTTPRSNEISWSSPILASVNGKLQLILQAMPNVAAYDLNSGAQLWSVDCMSGEVGPSPAFGGGYVYAANEYAKLVAIDPTSASIVWESMDRLPEVSSPVYYKGLVFVATTYSVLACIDATNGTMLWEYEAQAPFYSSPVIADGKLYIFDTNGVGYIFSPGKTANLIGTSNLGEHVYATPAFSQGVMYVRSDNHLYAIGKGS